MCCAWESPIPTPAPRLPPCAPTAVPPLLRGNIPRGHGVTPGGTQPGRGHRCRVGRRSRQVPPRDAPEHLPWERGPVGCKGGNVLVRRGQGQGGRRGGDSVMFWGACGGRWWKCRAAERSCSPRPSLRGISASWDAALPADLLRARMEWAFCWRTEQLVGTALALGSVPHIHREPLDLGPAVGWAVPGGAGLCRAARAVLPLRFVGAELI